MHRHKQKKYFGFYKHRVSNFQALEYKNNMFDMMKRQKLRRKLSRVLLSAALFIINSNICWGQTTFDYSDKAELFRHVVETHVIKHIENLNEVINYQRDKIRFSGFLLTVDTVQFVDTLTLDRGIMKCRLIGTDYVLVYYVNFKKWTAELLSYGNEGEQDFYIDGWNRFTKEEKGYLSKLSRFERQSLFLDIYLPSNYLIYGHEVNGQFSLVKRVFNTNGLTLRNMVFGKQGKDDFWIVNAFDTTRKYLIHLKMNNETPCSIDFVPKQNIQGALRDVLGYSNNYLGVRVKFRIRGIQKKW